MAAYQGCKEIRHPPFLRWDRNHQATYFRPSAGDYAFEQPHVATRKRKTVRCILRFAILARDV